MVNISNIDFNKTSNKTSSKKKKPRSFVESRCSPNPDYKVTLKTVRSDGAAHSIGSPDQQNFASPEYEILFSNSIIKSNGLKTYDTKAGKHNWTNLFSLPELANTNPEAGSKIIAKLKDPKTDINIVINFLVDHLSKSGTTDLTKYQDQEIKELFETRTDNFDLTLGKFSKSHAYGLEITYHDLNLKTAFPLLYKSLSSPNDIKQAQEAISGIKRPIQFWGSLGRFLPNNKLSRKFHQFLSKEEIPFNEELMRSAEAVSREFQIMDCEDKQKGKWLSKFIDKTLTNILLKQKIFKGINKAKSMDKLQVEFFASDRDNSSNFGNSVYTIESAEASKKPSEYLWRNIQDDKKQAYYNQLQSDKYMNEVHLGLIKQGIVPHMVSGALLEEAVERIKGASFAPPIMCLATGTEEYIRVNPSNLKEPKYQINPEYRNEIVKFLKDNNINYSKEAVVDRIKEFSNRDLGNDRLNQIKNNSLIFQEDMQRKSGNKSHEFITSLNLEATKSETESIANLLKIYFEQADIDCSVSFGVDAKGNQEESKNNNVTTHYINVTPRDFDGKKFYFDYAAKRIARLTKNLFKATKYHDKEISTISFGFADSANDVPSITESKTAGLAVVVANAKNLNNEESEFRKKLIPISYSSKNRLQAYFKTYSCPEEKKIDELISRLYQVDGNPHRYIYLADPNGNEEVNRAAYSGLALLRALKVTDHFVSD